MGLWGAREGQALGILTPAHSRGKEGKIYLLALLPLVTGSLWGITICRWSSRFLALGTEWRS